MHSRKLTTSSLRREYKIPFACGGGAVNQDFVSQYALGVYGEEAADAPKIADAIVAGTNRYRSIKRQIPQALR